MERLLYTAHEAAGHRKRVTVSGRSADDVNQKLTRKIADSDRGIPVSTESWTVEAYLKYWLQNVVRPKRPKTYQGYEGVARRRLVRASAGTSCTCCRSPRYGRS